MTPEQFVAQAEFLTGTNVKELSNRDSEHLAGLLSDENRVLDWSQFNELLLLVNKNRLTRAFFNWFFGETCAIKDIANGVNKFRIAAMRCYGNFIYAYRKLSKIDCIEEIKTELGEAARDAKATEDELNRRPKPLLNISLIGKGDTPLVGYLSTSNLRTDEDRHALLAEALATAKDWSDIDGVEKFKSAAKPFRDAHPDASMAELQKEIEDSAAALSDNRARLDSVLAVATKNQDIYLTWDYMDIYFATSMREPWEFQDLFDFIQGVMSDDALKDLNLRYFDPTQCYTRNRINKGLVEALMLKRAKCTVYSVQDIDTLGKDSELASTLAQGKTVIAYVPQVDVEKRASQLASWQPDHILKRLDFCSYFDSKFSEHLQVPIQPIVDVLTEYGTGRLWLTVPDPQKIDAFKAKYTAEVSEACRVIAESEKSIYNSRADTLIAKHPLGIQVHLETGVANGVLVVRDQKKCAELLRSVILGEMTFSLEKASLDGEEMWQLRETISGSVYRVVTGDWKLNNCFWNFYRLGKD